MPEIADSTIYDCLYECPDCGLEILDCICDKEEEFEDEDSEEDINDHDDTADAV